MGDDAAPLVRREIWALEERNTWDPYTLAYAKAILAMQRPDHSPEQTSYAYQAAVHGTDQPTDTGPDGVWNMCQHQSWFFLPWHRMYILWFERIVRSVVRSQHGPDDWALPYWNWQANRALPPAFREHTLPASEGGDDNPLFIAERGGVNDGARLAPAIVSSAGADSTLAFTSNLEIGYGGGVIDTPWHFGANVSGKLEIQPHNAVHRAIHGPMTTAASPLDPIFWLHHAQVDRLWGRWLRLAQGRKNPDDSRWLDQTFEFYDPGGTKVTQTPRQVVSTEALGYRYDDDPPPSAVPLTALVPEQAEAALELVQAITVRADNPEEIGTSAPLELGTGVTAARIPLAEMPEANLALLAAPDTSPSRVAMVVDEITLDDPEAPIYEIYLNMPDVGGGGHHDSPNFVGFLEFFGVGHGHGGHSEGAKRVFDITSVVHMLQQSGEWDPAHVDVSFVPARTLEDPETNSLMPAPVVGSPTVHVGAIRIVVE